MMRNDPIEQKKIEKERHSAFGFFVARLRFTILVIIAILFLGIQALLVIPRESDPEVKIPIAVVTTVFLGASPADVEQLVTDEIENKIEELDELDGVTSSSNLGVSSIVVEFEAEADLDQSIQDLKDKVDEVRGLPAEAEDPVVTQVRADDLPIITFSLAGNLDERRLKTLAKTLQDELEGIAGVSEVSIVGEREREFQIIVKKSTLERLNLPLGAVVSAVSSSNINSPLGNITVDKVDYNIRAKAKFQTIEELGNVVVSNKDGVIIKIKDIAIVKDDFSERKTLSKISIEGKPTVNTLSLQIFKRTGGNILNIVDTAKEKVELLKSNKTIPPAVDVVVSSDFSSFIREDLNTLGMSGLQAIVLIFLTIFLAIGFREAVVSLFSIPLTFFISIFILNEYGFTLNSMTLFSLVLSLGLLVDAFIIILRGIFDNMRKGYNAQDASLLSISNYFKPLVSGMLTTVAAFVPMLLVSGILGEFLKIMPITLSVVLTSALFVSLTIVPAVSAFILKMRDHNSPERRESILERFVTNPLRTKYRASLNTFLDSKKAKFRFSVILTMLFIASLGLLVSGAVKVQLFPKVDIDFSFIDLEMPVGTDLSVTEEVAREIEEYLMKRPEIQAFVTSVGQGSAFGFGEMGGSGEHLANFNITFRDEEERERKSYEINDEMREDLKKITKGKVTVREISSGPPTGAPIEIRITGQDLLVLDSVSETVMSELEKTDGVIDIDSDRQVSPPDITFSLKREELSRAVLTVPEVSSFLRTAIFGVTATEVNREGEEIDVVVQFDSADVSSVEALKNLSILNNRGERIKLSRVADISLEPALATIRHRDFERAVSVRANLQTGFTPSEIVPFVEKNIRAAGIPSGYAVEFGGEVEDIEQSFQELWNAMVLAVILILVILVLQFNSFVKPFVILMSLPLMLIGVVFGMLLFRLPFSFSVFLGLISLAGISVNDAIVLIDKANRNIQEYHMEPKEAVSQAGDSRLQPILLTTATTVMGVLPLALANEFWFGLSISIAFGLSFATALQLYVVPMLYLKLERRGRRKLERVRGSVVQ